MNLTLTLKGLAFSLRRGIKEARTNWLIGLNMKTEVIKVDANNLNFEAIEKAAGYILQGKIVALPTETVYGLAVDSGNPQALKRLYEVKQRTTDKPFTVAIADKEALEHLAQEVPLLAYKLADKFWPGPLTLVLKSNGEKTIGLRMPNHPVVLRLIEASGVNVVLPSANLSGENPAQSAQEVSRALNSKIDLILDGGKTALGIESTVVDLTQTPFKILREGSLKKEEIENIAKTKRVLFVCTGNSCRSVMAQGLLQKVMKERNRGNVEVLSAGVAALAGAGPTPETLRLLAQKGINMSAHRSRQVNRIMLRSADFILAMDDTHQARILELAPDVKNRLYLLNEFAKISNSGLNISDPIGRGMDFYERTFYMIKDAVEKISTLL